jgi:hypothetical protein
LRDRISARLAVTDKYKIKNTKKRMLACTFI